MCTKLSREARQALQTPRVGGKSHIKADLPRRKKNCVDMRRRAEDRRWPKVAIGGKQKSSVLSAGIFL